MKTKKSDEFLKLAEKRPRTKFAIVGQGSTWTFYEGADLPKAVAEKGETLIHATCQRSPSAMTLLVAGGTPEIAVFKTRVFAAQLKADPKSLIFKSVKAEDHAELEKLQAELDGTLVETVGTLPADARQALLPLLQQAQTAAADGDLAAAKSKVQQLKQLLNANPAKGPEPKTASTAVPPARPTTVAPDKPPASAAFKERLAIMTPQYQQVLKAAPPNKARLEQLMKQVVESAKAAKFDAGMGLLDQLDDELSKNDSYLEAKKAWGVAQAKKAYEAQMKEDASSPYNPGNKFAPQHREAAEKDRILDEAALQKFAKKYALEEAEVLAIRTYTAADYKYINPAVANQQDHPERQKLDKDGKPIAWMDAQHRPDPSKAKDETERKKLQKALEEYEAEKKKSMMQEGALHAGMLMEAFKKLPKKAGKLYRGQRMNMQRFNAEYSVGKQIPIEAFVSQSVKPSVARGFANGGGSFPPPPDATVSVFVEVDVVEARDISEMSIYGSEGEWLLPPGGKFVVDSVEEDTVHDVGRPPATAWKKVRMRQLPT